MIALIKIGDSIYENVPATVSVPTKFDESRTPIEFVQKSNPILPQEESSLKIALKSTISWYTDKYIRNVLNKIDEDLADLTSEAQVIEGRILYLAAKEGITVTTDEVKQRIALFIAGSYTEQDAINDLKEKGLSDETIQKILPLLQRGVEIAKILNWKEEIWAKEAELESQIDGMTLEQLLQLDVKALCEEAYKQIPLEV